MIAVAPLLTAEVGSARLEDLRRRHHHACGRRHRQCGERIAARRRRGRRRHPPRRRTGIACRMPDPRRLRNRFGQDNARLRFAGASTSSMRSVQSGTAAARARTSCWPPAIARPSTLRPRMGLRRLRFRRSRPAFTGSRPIVRRGPLWHRRRGDDRVAPRHRARCFLLLCGCRRGPSCQGLRRRSVWPKGPTRRSDEEAAGQPCGNSVAEF